LTTNPVRDTGRLRAPDAGYRTVVLPRFAVGMLFARKLTAAANLCRS